MTKSGLRGFSFGVLIACAVVAIYFYQFMPTHAIVKKTPLTEATVTNYLDQHHFVAVSKTQFDQWQAEKQAKTQSTSKDSKKNTSSDSSKAKSDKKVYSTTLNIKSGMLPSDVGNTLQSDHIIKDAGTFDTYMHKHGLEQYIQLGKFKVDSSMSIPQIAKVLTNH